MFLFSMQSRVSPTYFRHGMATTSLREDIASESITVMVTELFILQI